MTPKISINPLADFLNASEKRQRSIVHQQMNPPKILFPWYRTCKFTLVNSLSNHSDLDIVYNTIDNLEKTKPDSNFKIKDKRSSIPALQRYLEIRIPKQFKHIDIEVIKPKKKHLHLSGVEVKVAPEIIFRATIDGKKVIGAVKIHSSKSKIFDLKQARMVSSLMYKYLSTEVASEGEIVLPSLCFCLDIFSGRFVKTPDDFELRVESANKLCKEIGRIWKSA